MPQPWDPERWVQNEDGTYTRRHGERYYEDIETTGAAAELAAELGVDLSTVEGTGKGGRITVSDVRAAA
jgi:pyruvate/2-oxoglutarate dehydrogenase complex dihydrolipoamide acyltransferase (E2) component